MADNERNEHWRVESTCDSTQAQLQSFQAIPGFDDGQVDLLGLQATELMTLGLLDVTAAFPTNSLGAFDLSHQQDALVWPSTSNPTLSELDTTDLETVSTRLLETSQHGARAGQTRVTKLNRVRTKVSPKDAPTACWRCRRYKKPCDDQAVCGSCLTSGFRIWPSEIGCRRERLASLSDCFIPAIFEQVIANADPMTTRLMPWRDRVQMLSESDIVLKAPEDLPGKEDDVWTSAKRCMRSIASFGSDFDELIDIAQAYQASLPKPTACIDQACKLVIVTCQLYHCFVRSSGGATTFADPTFSMRVVAELRRQLGHTFALIERMCLSAKPDWFAATMSVSLTTCAAVVFTDAIISMPPAFSTAIWGSLPERLEWFRNGSYSMLVDCLRVSSKGLNPINMTCFQLEEAGIGNSASQKAPDTLLPPLDALTLQSGRRLKAWLHHHDAVMKRTTSIFQLQIYGCLQAAPVGVLAKVYLW